MNSALKIKVCGNKNPENFVEIAKLDIDYMGFIFYQDSPRNVNLDLLQNSDFQNITIPKVAVTVNQDISFFNNLIEDFEAFQLHGFESANYCNELKKTSEKPIIKAFAIDPNFSFKELEMYQDVVDYFLFDTKGKNYGGNGQKFTWKKLEEYTLETPFFLSGGIGPEDAKDIQKIEHPSLIGIDLNSGFETEPGKKDITLLQKFIPQLCKNMA